MINEKIRNDYELYHGADIMVDYKKVSNGHFIDYFEDSSNLEGFATLASIDLFNSTFKIKEYLNINIPLCFLIAMSLDSNEMDFINLDSYYINGIK